MEEKKKKEVEEIFFEINNMMDKIDEMCEIFFKNNDKSEKKSIEETIEFLQKYGFSDKDLKTIIYDYFDGNNNEEMSKEINEISSTPNINNEKIQENNLYSSHQNNEEDNNKKKISKKDFYCFLLFFEAKKTKLKIY